MATFTDTDELRAYLATITTYEDFWDAKEPAFHDVAVKTAWDALIAQGWSSSVALDALKAGEVWAFVREQDVRRADRLH